MRNRVSFVSVVQVGLVRKTVLEGDLSKVGYLQTILESMRSDMENNTGGWETTLEDLINEKCDIVAKEISPLRNRCIIKDTRFEKTPYPRNGEVVYGWIYDVDVIRRCGHVEVFSLFRRVSPSSDKYEEEPECCESVLEVSKLLSEYLCAECLMKKWSNPTPKD